MKIDLPPTRARRGADELLVETELATKLGRGSPGNQGGFDPRGPTSTSATLYSSTVRQLQDLATTSSSSSATSRG
jgi:hypothetical protein